MFDDLERKLLEETTYGEDMSPYKVHPLRKYTHRQTKDKCLQSDFKSSEMKNQDYYHRHQLLLLLSYDYIRYVFHVSVFMSALRFISYIPQFDIVNICRHLDYYDHLPLLFQ